MSIFYDTYGTSKNYTTPDLSPKHIRRFDQEVWGPARMDVNMRCLEVGCGTGQFLAYLDYKGIADFQGFDLDPALSEIVPPHVRNRFSVAEVHVFLATNKSLPPFDRIFMFDVFEHFTPEDGHALLVNIVTILKPGGAVVLKMPNVGSPWGLQFQFGDLTHLAGYTPDSIRQMATAVGLTCTSCHPHLLGSRSRQRTDRLIQWILNRLVATPPAIWEGNFYAILTKPD